MTPRTAARLCCLLLTFGLAVARADAPATPAAQAPPEAGGCLRRYADAFVALNNLAGERRLKAESARTDVDALFGERPARCEAGAYEYYLDQLVLFARRALRSGATPQTPKEGWVRAAAVVCAHGPQTVPAAEHVQDLARFQAAERELAPLFAEAGALPAATALREALLAAAPATEAVVAAPRTSPGVLTDNLIVPDTEPPPAPLLPDPPGPAEGGLVDSYVARAAGFYKTAQYDRAVNELQKAYLLRPRPLYLFNIAQAYRRAGRVREALRGYRDYLTRDSDPKLVAEATGHAADMEKLLAAQERAERVGQALQAEQGKRAGVQQDLLQTQRRADRAERERRRPVYRRGWFWGVLVTSVAAVSAGVALTAIYARDPATDGGIVNLHF